MKQLILLLIILLPIFLHAQIEQINQSDLYVKLGITRALKKNNIDDSEIIWHFDSLGRTTSILWYNAKQNEPYRREKFYFIENLLTKKHAIYSQNSSLKQYDTTYLNYSYDINNNLVKKVQTSSSDKDTSISFLTYNNGFLIHSSTSEITTDYLQDSMYFEYSENGNLQSKTLKRFDEDFVWLLVKTKFSQNKPKSQIKYCGYTGFDYPSSINTFIYNNGKLIGKRNLVIEIFHGYPSTNYFEEFEYNEWGLVSKITYYRNEEIEKIETYIYN